MMDTSKEIESRYIGLLMSLSPGKRLAMACRMFSTAKSLIKAGAKHQNSNQELPDDIRSLIFLRLYGNDFSEVEQNRILEHLSKNS